MTYPDRSTAPPIQRIEKIDLPEPEVFRLPNNTSCQIINLGDQPVLRLELAFKAGRRHESARMVSGTAARLLREGTAQKSSFDISNLVDFYGASLNITSTADFSIITLYCLSNHFEKLMPLVTEILSSSTMPEAELSNWKVRRGQMLMVDLEKVDYLAQRKFNEVLFGENHFMGYAVTKEAIDALDRNALLEFAAKKYSGNYFLGVLAGAVQPAHLEILKQELKKLPPGKILPEVSPAPVPHENKFHFIEKKDANQSAIRMGRLLFNRSHPDYFDMRILAVVFGGYFGSRLMKNIREEKGYTYGIHSSFGVFEDAGYMVISTEVGSEVVVSAVEEIKTEMLKLQNELVSAEELESVTNYMLGVILGDVDGALNIAEVIKNLRLYNLDNDFFQRNIQSIQNINPQRLQDLARKYLQPDDFHLVVAGPQYSK